MNRRVFAAKARFADCVCNAQTMQFEYHFR